METHITVVYTIRDNDAFESIRKKIFEDFADDKDAPYAVTAVSLDHEIQRMHWVEQATTEVDDFFDLKDILDAIAGHPNIASIESLDDLR